MPKRVRVFFAYPDEPSNVGETIKASIRRLDEQGVLNENNVRIKPWSQTSVSGKRLDATILSQINKHEVFACDLTYPNLNVSFELGYAIARFKRVLACINPDIMYAQKRYSRIYQNLLNMGYVEFHNHEGLSNAIREVSPWTSLQKTYLHNRYRNQRVRLEQPTLVYIKPPLTSDSVLNTHEALRGSIFGESLVVDDPIEFPSHSLEWYAERFVTADAIVIHLLSSDHVYNQRHNLKASLIAGLAIGFKKPTIMLAHAPYQAPSDYGDWLKVHETAKNCVSEVKSWLCREIAKLPHRRPRREDAPLRVSQELDIRRLFLGEIVAEHESEDIQEYFVETANYYQAIDNPATILIGRRGTGKTAILYAIVNQLSKSAENHITVLKPVGYETHGLIRVLNEIRERSERGFLIESLWKFLIYSEIAKSLTQEIMDRPAHHDRNSNEMAFLEYYESKSPILDPPFSERLGQALKSLEGLGEILDAGSQRRRISEELHDLVIGRLRFFLGTVLSDNRKLTVLIDGLDGPWAPGEHIAHLAELIGGLLDVVQLLPKELGKSSSNLNAVDARVIVFLRSDIFAYLKHLLPEQDKLPIERLFWSDRQELLRVLEERMLCRAPQHLKAREIWTALFPESVDGLSCMDYILQSALPRPRDIINLLKLAVRVSVNRGHETVLDDDFSTARSQYSNNAFESVVNEDDPSKGMLEEVLYEFTGPSSTCSRTEIERRFSSAGVKAKDVEPYMDLLCDISFLGVETVDGFQFANHEEERRRLRSLARVIASRQDRSENYKVNPAFYPALGIE